MDASTKKSRTRRCPKPFPVKNHTKCYETNLKLLSSAQAAKASRIWPEKNLGSSTYYCFKCRLYIEKYKEAGKSFILVAPRGLWVHLDEAVRFVSEIPLEGEAASSIAADKTEGDTHNEPSGADLERTEYSPDSIEFNAEESSLSLDFSHLDIQEQSFQFCLPELNFLLNVLHLPELKEFQLSPSRKYVLQSRYQSALNSISTAFEEVAASFGVPFNRLTDGCVDCQNLLVSMKRRYAQLESKELRYLMLTCAPKSLSAPKLQEKIGCSSHEARVAHDLRQEQEFNAFVSPHWKSTAHPLAQDLKQSIIEFYLRDSNSRPSPNKRDVRRVFNKSSDSYELKAKRWILINLEELYQLFLKEYVSLKVHITTFANQRPPWCIWPGRYGHNISCTCVPHKNFRNRLSAAKFQGSIQEFLSQYICNEPERDCYMGTCSTCPMLDEILEMALPEDVITYEQWQNSHRSITKVLVQQSAEDFLQSLQEEFTGFLTHFYVTKEQQRFIDQLKTELPTDEIIVQVDFAENYAFNVQAAPTSFHWNNSQATIHPFCVTYRMAEELTAKTFVVVSDCMDHSAASFHWFQTLFFKALREEDWFEKITKVHYVSDGAGSQYKNKFNFRNLQSHYEDFGTHAAWNFFASAHGKGPCDAASGSVKATAHRAALKGRTILCPLQLYEFFKEKMVTPTRDFIYAENLKFDKFRAELRGRFENIDTVVGTRKFHSIRASPTGLQFRFLSYDKNFTTIDLSVARNANMPKYFHQKGDFVVVKSDRSFVFGQILDILDDNECFQVKLMRRSGIKNIFFWPDIHQIVMVALQEIRFKTGPPAPVGRRPRYCKMSDQDFDKASSL